MTGFYKEYDDTSGAYVSSAEDAAAAALVSKNAAAASATAAAASELSAGDQATAASLSQTNAGTSATNAATSATNAATSETNAAGSATAAAGSATSASTDAGTATTKASEASTSATNAATSETNAASSATNAATSETNAATSATNAASSATTASTQATNAASSATAAATSETNAGNSATAAATSETNAASSATSASGSATTATTKAGEAATSATNAATSETNAATSATNSANSATSAGTAQTAAEAARDAALAAFDSFDDRYLGPKASDPTTDNDGDALAAGMLYFNTTTDDMKVYEGSSWVAAYASLSGALLATNNLSDLNNVATARTNLGLGTAATTASTDYATSAQGTTADNALPKSGGAMTGAITTNSTFDGRDVATDGTKLDGIEANADVTDTANVTDAGALMDSELTSIASVKALDQGVATTDSPAFAGLTVDTDTLAVDSTNNRVGVGTASPSAPLTIQSDVSGISDSLEFVNNTGNGNYIKGKKALTLSADYDNNSGVGQSYVSFDTDGSERMRIDSSGQVGIGTASPASALDVNGTVTCDDLQVDLPNATASCQITTPTNLSGFQAFQISNSHTTGTLTMGTALGAARIQSFGNMGAGIPLKIDLGNTTALDFATTGITTLGMSGQSQLVLDKRGTQNTFKYVSATAFNSGLQSAHFYGTSMLSSSISANTIYGVALPSSGSTGRFYPAQSGVNGLFRDNSIDCGHPSARWDDVYATNGTIQTSDEREKQDIEELTDVEQRVAVRAKGLLRKFRWKDSVESKGDDARIHFGIIAQDLEAAFVAEGLDPSDYAMFIKTEWWIGDKTWPAVPEELDEEGNVISEGKDSHVEEEHYYEDEADAPSDATHHYRMGVRYSELLAFIIAAL